MLKLIVNKESFLDRTYDKLLDLFYKHDHLTYKQFKRIKGYLCDSNTRPRFKGLSDEAKVAVKDVLNDIKILKKRASLESIDGGLKESASMRQIKRNMSNYDKRKKLEESYHNKTDRSGRRKW